MIATAMSERLGKQVVVDNRAGAGGVIGTELAANAPHDGYTLLIISLAHAVNQWSKLLFRIADKVARFKMLRYGHEPNAHLCDNAIVGLREESV